MLLIGACFTHECFINKLNTCISKLKFVYVCDTPMIKKFSSRERIFLSERALWKTHNGGEENSLLVSQNKLHAVYLSLHYRQ